MTNFEKFATGYNNLLLKGLAQLEYRKIEEAVNLIRECKGTVWLIGNGGSATLASHMATDLQLAGVRAISLTDVAAVTTYGNDQHFSRIFSQQLIRFQQEGDIVIAISGSGNSHNLLNAVDNLNKDITLITVTGFEGGLLSRKIHNGAEEKLDNAIHLRCPAPHMGVSQDLHQVVLHMICYYLMEGVRK